MNLNSGAHSVYSIIFCLWLAVNGGLVFSFHWRVCGEIYKQVWETRKYSGNVYDEIWKMYPRGQLMALLHLIISGIVGLLVDLVLVFYTMFYDSSSLILLLLALALLVGEYVFLCKLLKNLVKRHAKL